MKYLIASIVAIISLFLVFACVEELKTGDSFSYYSIVKDEEIQSSLKSCFIKFGITNYSGNFTLKEQDEAIAEAFESWQPEITKLYFAQAGINEKKDFAIEFSAENLFSGKQKNAGLLKFKTGDVLSIIRLSDTQPFVKFVLNENYHWDKATFKGVILFLTGKVLGLQVSEVPGSILNEDVSKLNTKNAPGSEDLETVKNLLQNKCKEEIFFNIVTSASDSGIDLNHVLSMRNNPEGLVFENGFLLSTDFQFPTLDKYARIKVLDRNVIKTNPYGSPIGLNRQFPLDSLKSGTSYYLRGYFKDNTGRVVYSKQLKFKTN
ncbi:Matrixin [Pseudarcicella hirudinis]|uniref:Matrixin n=1 Tax=Pseudarcicella hirudinis TaxID=1079859 RepID=A0A1I5M6G3_9BACT|nr:matrixin family metalloprotease [Pseudarcicella hirudinis]SFP05194.1 Matrixin [Pseudarcicella hirudinis]